MTSLRCPPNLPYTCRGSWKKTPGSYQELYLSLKT